MFSKLLCIVNISRCKKQLKLHRSLLGVKGGGGWSKQPSLQHLAVTIKIKFLGHIFVRSTTSQQILFDNVDKNTIQILSIFFLKLGGGGRK